MKILNVLTRQKAVPDVVLSVGSLAEARIESDRQFNQFYRLVGAQVMQFAMQIILRTICTFCNLRHNALTTGTKFITGISSNVNASALGQTDLVSTGALVQSEAYALSGGFPPIIKDTRLGEVKWIERLSTVYLGKTASTNLFFRELSLQAQSRFEVVGIPLNSWIEDTSVEGLNSWIENNLITGRDGNVLLSPMYQLTLQALMERVVRRCCGSRRDVVVDGSFNS